MSASIESNSSKPVNKKRTVYAQKSLLELPDWAKEDKTHKFRWVSKRRISRSDGFDPRGWVVAKCPKTGEGLEAYDSVLYKMPNDMHEAMREHKAQLARDNIRHVLESIDSQQDRLKYEVERMGGRLPKTEFSIERKN